MPLLSTFESPYYKGATLGDPLGDTEKNYLKGRVNRYFGETHDLTKSIYNACKDAVDNFPEFFDAGEMEKYFLDAYEGSINAPAVKEGLRLFKVALSRKKQDAQAQAQAQAQAAAYAAAMAEQAAPSDPEETEPAQAVEVVEAVELPEGLDASDVIAINEAARAVDLDALSREAQEQAAQAVEAYAAGRATPQQVEAAIDTAAVVEQEKTRNALWNVGLPLTLAVGLFIFFFKGKKS